MESNLKVGMSFEVVEVLNSAYGKGTFSPTRTTIMLGDFAIPNSDYYRDDYKADIFNKHYGCLAISGSEIKPIGKLTITKVK